MMRKQITILKSEVLFSLAFVSFMFLVSCSDDVDDNVSPDLNLPVKVNTIHPSLGKYLETVTIEGENFGNNPQNLRVFFNKKQAEILEITNHQMLVRVPRLPGDECKIGVLSGGNTTDTVFCSQTFSYTKGYHLEYVCGQIGSSNRTFWEGKLSTMAFGEAMQWLACDDAGAVYLNEGMLGNEGTIALINETRGYAKRLGGGDESSKGGQVLAPWYDVVTKKVYVCAAHRAYFWEIDPADDWSVVQRQVVAPDEEYIDKGYHTFDVENIQWCYSYVRCSDGYIYCRTYSGLLFRFKLEERVLDMVTELCPKSPVDSYICGDPEDLDKIYCSLKQKNIITCIDITKQPTDPDFEVVVCGIEGGGDFQDGNVTEAKLNEPSQIVVTRHPETNEKVIYICDSQNRRIREFNMETKNMTTIAGVGGGYGYSTGLAIESKMNYPTGICLNPDGDLYIADRWNRVLLKLVFM